MSKGATMPESVKVKPPIGHASWVDAAVNSFPNTNCEIPEHVSAALAESLARAELSDLRARLSTATELLREIEPLARHEIQCCLPRPEFAKRLAAFLEGCSGELEKQVNALKSDPTTRARITLAIEQLVAEKA